VQDFSFGYFLELMARVINVDMLLALFVITVCFWYCSQWIRFTTVTIVGLMFVAWQGTNNEDNLITQPVAANNVQTAAPRAQAQVVTQEAKSPDQQLKEFYQQQSLLASQFPQQ
jgi:hypothetical protein